jgi:hypothetical protein
MALRCEDDWGCFGHRVVRLSCGLCHLWLCRGSHRPEKDNLVYADFVLRLFCMARVLEHDRRICLPEFFHMVLRRGRKLHCPALPGGIVARTYTRETHWLDDGVLRSWHCALIRLVFVDHSDPGLALDDVPDRSLRPYRRHHAICAALGYFAASADSMSEAAKVYAAAKPSR